MIEAVNASISTAASVRAIAQQVSTSESLSANPGRVQKVAAANYTSNYIQLTPDIKPIFVVRDISTGESIRQFPTEGQIRAYQRAQQVRDAAQSASKPPVEATQMKKTDEAAVLLESSVQFKEVRAEVKKVDAPPPPVPGQTKAEVKVGGDTGSDVKVETRFTADV